MTLKAVEAPVPLTARSRVTGAAMDRPLPKRPPNYAIATIGALLLLAGIAALTRLVPHGLQVAESDIRTATVQQGSFHNDVVVRSTAATLHTIMLDVLESGRVEEVLVNDGALVEKDALLFRLSNPQLRLNLVAREADRAQQISNLSTLRVSIETSQTEHQRRMLDLNFAVTQADKQYTRNASLAKSGVIAAVTVEESQDRLAQQRQALEDEKIRAVIEMRIKRDSVRQMEEAIEQLDGGLKVVNDAIEGLAVRAPIAGRLTDFRLQLGEIVKSEQRIGRIDDPSQFKLTAHIDEYYLGGVSVGKTGSVNANGREYGVVVNRVFPQITDGQFLVELLFTGDTPLEMNPGQAVETRITLGEASLGLIMPNDSYVSDTGGAWAFVVAPDGRTATRRKIRIGRRNNSQIEVASGLTAGERVIVSAYAGFGKAEQLQFAK
jgi:HlyD family secretion protein